MPPKPATIAYFIDTYPSPPHTFVWREIRALEAAGWTVHRFTGYPAKAGNDPTQREEIARSNVIMSGGRIALIPAALRELTRSPRRFLSAFKLMRRLAKNSDRGAVVTLGYFLQACVLRDRVARCGAVHLHAHFGSNSTEIALYCHALGGPQFSATFHGPHEFDRAQTLNIDHKVVGAAFVACISRFCRGQVVRWCRPEDAKKLHIVHCGVSADQVEQPFVPTPPADRPRLLTVSRLHPEKGHLVMLAALRKLRDQGESFDARIAGTGPFEDVLKRRVEELGLTDCVTFLGWQTESDVAEELRRCVALVQPSYAEGLPVSVMEACAAGRPVVASDVAAMHELVATNTTGWLVRPGSVWALANALRKALHADTATRERLGREGQRRVRKNHDARKEAAKLATLIRAAIDKSFTAA